MFEERKLYASALKRQRPQAQDHPSNIQTAIAHTKPYDTTNIAKKQTF